MNYIAIDFEWNQPTNKNKIITKPIILNGEIIRIGAVKLIKTDNGYTLGDTIHLGVIPKYYKHMNSIVGKVTGLGNSDLTFGYDFKKAYNYLMQWCKRDGDEFSFLAWGGEDEKILNSNMKIHGITEDAPKFYDIQKVFGLKITKNNQQYSATGALELLGLEAGLKAHVALSDAIFAGRIAVTANICDMLCDYEEMLEKEAIKRTSKSFEKYGFVRTIEAAYGNKDVMSVKCPACQGELELYGKWKYIHRPCSIINICTCKIHGDYSVTIKKLYTKDRKNVIIAKQVKSLTDNFKDKYKNAIVYNVNDKLEFSKDSSKDNND